MAEGLPSLCKALSSIPGLGRQEKDFCVRQNRVRILVPALPTGKLRREPSLKSKVRPFSTCLEGLQGGNEPCV